MNRLRGTVTAFLLLKLGVPAVNLGQFPVSRRQPEADPWAVPAAARSRPSVSLLVPMRNEAARLAASVPVLLAQPVDELILLDDESTDGTGALARSLLAGHWACHHLAARATPSLLVFRDADVLLAEGPSTP